MAEGIHWKTISRFESHDFVANWYRKAHGRDANAAKVRQINACFAHGREYFRNAGRSEMSVKPLLLYYGVLSCCRGVILANDPVLSKNPIDAVRRADSTLDARRSRRS